MNRHERAAQEQRQADDARKHAARRRDQGKITVTSERGESETRRRRYS